MGGRVGLWGVSVRQDGSLLLPDVVGTVVCPFEATAGAPATDVPGVGWWPSSYAYC